MVNNGNNKEAVDSSFLDQGNVGSFLRCLGTGNRQETKKLSVVVVVWMVEDKEIRV